VSCVAVSACPVWLLCVLRVLCVCVALGLCGVAKKNKIIQHHTVPGTSLFVC
jgi:hypothetical protein